MVNTVPYAGGQTYSAWVLAFRMARAIPEYFLTLSAIPNGKRLRNATKSGAGILDFQNLGKKSWGKSLRCGLFWDFDVVGRGASWTAKMGKNWKNGRREKVPLRFI
jgi:hypothetical protein